jgi:predicted Fe-Mo cluster-binding NifX family protein
MKIAVTSRGNTLDSEVDLRFGRAAQFILYDDSNETIAIVDNAQSLNAAQGAGIQAAETLSRQDVDCLISGHCGPNAFHTLSAAGIKVYTGVKGTVAEVLTALKEGKLEAADSADKQGHWS